MPQQNLCHCLEGSSSSQMISEGLLKLVYGASLVPDCWGIQVDEAAGIMGIKTMQARPLYIVSVAARTLARSLTSKLDQYHKTHDAHLLYYTTATTTTYALKLTSMLCLCHEEKKERERERVV